MFHVITEPCVGRKDGACVAVCPVDAIHPRRDEAGLRRRRSCISIQTRASGAGYAWMNVR